MLKDYRDRAGDARYGKPTLLLRFGSTATCAASLAALVLANALLFAAVQPPLALALPLEALLVGIAVLLLRLHRARDSREEQIAIGLGARLGNGVLICLLAWLVLGGEGATEPLARRSSGRSRRSSSPARPRSPRGPSGS